MRLDFEKYLNNNGLKLGDKVKLSNGDIFEICQSIYGNLMLRNLGGTNLNCTITLLGSYDFEKIEPKKKRGELLCDGCSCDGCPLQCISCVGCLNNTLRENFEETLEVHPQLEPMRAYFEKELDKEEEN